MNNITNKNNTFFSWISTEKKYKKINPWLNWLFFFIFILVVVLSFINVNFNIAPLGGLIFKENLSKIFSFNAHSNLYPETNLWNLSFELLWETICQTLLGTVIGCLCALLTSYFSYKKTSNVFLSYLLSSIIFILRCLPVLIFIYFFQLKYSKSLGLLLILIWFTWLWVHKYLIEIFKSTNFDYYDQLIVEGNNKIFSFFKSVYYQVRLRIVTLFLYSFESNVRWSTLLGSLGLSGIGQLIQQSQQDYSIIGIPIMTISIFLLVLEIFIIFIKKTLINEPLFVKKFNDKKYLVFLKTKQLITIFLFLIIASILIYSIFVTNFNSPKNITGDVFLKNIFSPNWSVLNSPSNSEPIIIQIIDLFSQTIVILFISLALFLILLFFGNKFLFKKTYFITQTISSIIRAVPPICLIFIIGGLYSTSTSTICMSLSIPLSTIIFKMINEKNENISGYNIQLLYTQGYSRIYIFRNYLLLNLKKNIIMLGLFEFENSFRNLIIYGAYGSTEIGALIDIYFKRSQYNEIGALLWIVYFCIILINFMIWIIKIFIVDKEDINWKEKFIYKYKWGKLYEKCNSFFKSIINR